MSVRPYRDILRRKSRQIHVGKVPVGGDSPITVQSMTNTRTTDIQGTIDQVRALEVAGADIVRISCPDEESTAALKKIIPEVTVPIVADIHFHYRRCGPVSAIPSASRSRRIRSRRSRSASTSLSR